ncbi:unnamed protein product [Notodromas monacha]|uniref:Uncharacterized protein n=1 Tax=Notodromas monacha TaxID=399045 RepID=A0A7R9GGZ9_9CRUS|nr:unnamed protein product [Notodromas monacha]CAG0920399.1 unnamed protein product [Notodromas monacha]
MATKSAENYLADLRRSVEDRSKRTCGPPASKWYSQLFYPIHVCFQKQGFNSMSQTWVHVAKEILQLVSNFLDVGGRELFSVCRFWLSLCGQEIRACCENVENTVTTQFENCLEFAGVVIRIMVKLSGHASKPDVAELSSKILMILTTQKASPQAVLNYVKDILTAFGDVEQTEDLSPWLNLFGSALVAIASPLRSHEHVACAVEAGRRLELPEDIVKYAICFGDLIETLRGTQCNASGIYDIKALSASVQALLEDEAVAKVTRTLLLCYRFKISTVADELQRAKSADSGVAHGSLLFEVITKKSFIDLIETFPVILSLSSRILAIENFNSLEVSSDPVILLGVIQVCTLNFWLSACARREKLEACSNQKLLATSALEIWKNLSQHAMLYDCWRGPGVDNQKKLKFLESTLKRIRVLAHYIGQTLADLQDFAKLFSLLQDLCFWYFLPTGESSKSLQTVLNGDPESLMRTVFMSFVGLLNSKPSKKDIGLGFQLFFEVLKLFVSQRNASASFGSRKSLSKCFEYLAKIWYKLVHASEAEACLKEMLVNKPEDAVSSLSWHADRLVGLDSVLREISFTCFLSDLENCMTNNWRKQWCRKELLTFVFERGALMSKNNSDLVGYGTLSARTAQAIFFTPGDLVLQGLLEKNVVPALKKALPHLLNFASPKSLSVYDSEARKLETELRLTVAEIEVALWMSEQVMAINRIRQEVGWKNALHFAYDCDLAEHGDDSDEIANKITSCLALRYGHQLDSAKHLVSALENLKLCDIEKTNADSRAIHLLKLLASLFGMFGMLREETEAHEWLAKIFKVHSVNSFEASIIKMQTSTDGKFNWEPIDEELRSVMNRQATEETPFLNFLTFRGETMNYLLRQPHTKTTLSNVVKDTQRVVKSCKAWINPPSVAQMLSLGKFHMALGMRDGHDSDLPSRVKFLTFAMKSMLSVIYIPAASEPGLIMYLTAIKCFYDCLEVLICIGRDFRLNRIMDAFCHIGWLVAVSLGLAFRGISTMINVADVMRLSVSTIHVSRKRFMDAYTSLVVNHEKTDKSVAAPKILDAKSLPKPVAASKYPASAAKNHLVVSKRAKANERTRLGGLDELVLNASLAHPAVLVDDVDSISFHLKNLDVEDDGMRLDEADFMVSRDRLDNLGECAKTFFHPMTCECRSCGIDMMALAMKTALLRMRLMIIGKNFNKIKECIADLKFGEQKMLKLCDGDLKNLNVPVAITISLTTSLLTMRHDSWRFENPDKLLFPVDSLKALDFKLWPPVISEGLLLVNASAGFIAAFGTKIFASTPAPDQIRVMGRWPPEKVVPEPIASVKTPEDRKATNSTWKSRNHASRKEAVPPAPAKRRLLKNQTCKSDLSKSSSASACVFSSPLSATSGHLLASSTKTYARPPGRNAGFTSSRSPLESDENLEQKSDNVVVKSKLKVDQQSRLDFPLQNNSDVLNVGKSSEDTVLVAKTPSPPCSARKLRPRLKPNKS